MELGESRFLLEQAETGPPRPDLSSRPVALYAVALETRPTTLGGIKAARILVRYREDGTYTVIQEEEVLAIRPNGNAVYEVGLTSTEGKYKDDLLVFERLLKTWKIVPMTE